MAALLAIVALLPAACASVGETSVGSWKLPLVGLQEVDSGDTLSRLALAASTATQTRRITVQVTDQGEESTLPESTTRFEMVAADGKRYSCGKSAPASSGWSTSTLGELRMNISVAVGEAMRDRCLQLNTGFWTIQLCDDTAVQLHSEAVAPSLLRRSVDSTSRGTLWGHALEPHARAAHTDTAPPTQGAREAEVTVLLGTYAGEASDRIALLPDGGVGLIRSYTRGQDGREARVLFVADEDEDAAVQATGGDGAARPTASLAAAEEAESLRYRLRVRVSLPAVLARLRERVKAGSSAAAAAAGGGAAAPAAAPPATADRALEGLYVMRSALSVLRRLRGLCAVVKDSWWTTEACVGLAARQYHQNELGQKEQQVSLGAFDAEAVAEQERGRPEASSTGKDATRGAELGPDGAELGPPTGSAHGPTGVSGPPGEPRGRDGSPLPDPSQLVRIGGLGALVQTLERGQPPHESSPQPFLAQRFAHGDDCGEARPGRKRELELRLACKPGVRLEVTSLTEPETCRYVLSGFSAAVCSHPLLRLHTAMLPAASGALPGGGVTCHRV